MFDAHIVRCLVYILYYCGLGACALVAQERLPPILVSPGATTGDVYFAPRFIRYDSIVIVSLENEAIVSRDGGHTFRAMPIDPARHSYIRSHCLKGPSLIAYSFAEFVTLNPRCSTWIFDHNLNLLRQTQPFPDSLFELDMVMWNVGDTLVGTGGSGTSVSVDSGKTWTFRPALAVKSRSTCWKDLRGRIAISVSGRIHTSADGGHSWLPDSSYPHPTEWAHYLSDSVWLATRSGLTAGEADFFISKNAGQTWDKVDSIVCTNGVTVGKLNANNGLVWSSAKEPLTLAFHDGNVITTNDAGTTWMFRGKLGTINLGGRMPSLTPDSATLIHTNSGLWEIGRNPFDMAKQVAVGEYFGPALKLDSTTFLSSGAGVFMRSTDGGASWENFSSNSDASRMRQFHYGLFVAPITTVSASDTSNITVTSYCEQLIHGGAAALSYWKFLSPGTLTRPVDLPLPPHTCSGRSAWSVGNEFFAAGGRTDRQLLVRSMDNGTTFDTIRPVPGYLIQFVTRIDSMLYVVGDSLLSEDGVGWKYDGAGIPVDFAGRQRIQTMTSTPTGTLLVGVKGYREIDTNDVRTLIGTGMWRRERGDTTWSKVEGYDDATINVMDLMVTAFGTVLATTCIVEHMQPFATHQQDDSYILRSTDDGITWQIVNTQTYRGPELVNPLRFAQTSTGHLYASSTRGALLESVDDGLSWQEVVSWVASSPINDLHVDTNDVLYVATDSALYLMHPQRTSVVHDGIVAVLDLEVRPNPATQYVDIVIYNPELARGGVRSLKVIGVLGLSELDVTDQLPKSMSGLTHIVRVDVSKLNQGTYVVAMTVGNRTIHDILCVVR